MSGIIRALCHRAHQSSTTRDVALDRHLPDCEDILKEVIWAFSDFARDRRGVRDPEARYLAGNPWYPVAGQLRKHSSADSPAFAQPS